MATEKATFATQEEANSFLEKVQKDSSIESGKIMIYGDNKVVHFDADDLKDPKII